jgi:hypothetical protein
MNFHSQPRPYGTRPGLLDTSSTLPRRDTPVPNETCDPALDNASSLRIYVPCSDLEEPSFCPSESGVILLSSNGQLSYLSRLISLHPGPAALQIRVN